MRRTGYRYFLWYYCTVLSGKMWQEIWTKVEPEINNCSSATLVYGHRIRRDVFLLLNQGCQSRPEPRFWVEPEPFFYRLRLRLYCKICYFYRNLKKRKIRFSQFFLYFDFFKEGEGIEEGIEGAGTMEQGGGGGGVGAGIFLGPEMSKMGGSGNHVLNNNFFVLLLFY